MNKVIFQDTTDPVRRLRLIEDNCETVLENYEYQRHFEAEEIEAMEHDLSQALIKIQVLEEKLATIKADFKEQIDPVKEIIKTYTKRLRDGFERVTGTCYAFIDTDSKEFGVYSPEGVLISVPRKLRSDEGVQKTFSLKEGTNG